MASAICARNPELCSLIISHLIRSESSVAAHGPLSLPVTSSSSVAAYALVSREWRTAVERHTFSILRLDQSRLADFARMVTARRRSLVRGLRFDIMLDAYGTELWGSLETAEEQERNNVTFTRAMETLFSHLSTWRPQDVRESGIELSLRAYSPSDLAGMDRNARWKRLCSEGPHDIQDLRFERSYLRLVATNENASSQQEPLPELSIVTKLELKNTRFFWPATACLIASKLPRLVNIDFCLWDSEKKDLPLRLRTRSGKDNISISLS